MQEKGDEEKKMKLPFPIRGTDEWDSREYRRFLSGCVVMSFGPLTPEVEEKYFHVRKRGRAYLAQRGVSPVKIEEWASCRVK